MDRVEDLNDMYFFAEVVEHGSYAAAARALGLQTSKLSRHISQLEDQLGVRLLNRTTRRLSLTEAGHTFYRHCVALVAEARAAKEAIDRTRSTPQGVVRISCPPGLLQSDVTKILARYLSTYPQVRISLEATNRKVDVVEEGVDIALRVRLPPLEDSDLAARVLGTSSMVLVASAKLFEHYQRPRKPSDLALLPTLAMSRAGDKYVWTLRGIDGTQVEIQHTPRLATDDMATLRQAALDGAGVTLLPKNLLQDALADGSLEHVLPELESLHGVVHAVFPSRRGLVPAVRALLDALAAGFGQE